MLSPIIYISLYILFPSFYFFAPFYPINSVLTLRQVKYMSVLYKNPTHIYILTDIYQNSGESTKYQYKKGFAS